MLLAQLNYNLPRYLILSESLTVDQEASNHRLKEPNLLCRKTENSEINLKILMTGLVI